MKASSIVAARNIYDSYEMCREALALKDDDLKVHVFGNFDVGGRLSSALTGAAERSCPAIILEIRAALTELIAEKKAALEDLGVEFPAEGKGNDNG